ncbi:kinase-like protein, partial [Thozetella sp. PMI_491]
KGEYVNLLPSRNKNSGQIYAVKRMVISEIKIPRDLQKKTGSPHLEVVLGLTSPSSPFVLNIKFAFYVDRNAYLLADYARDEFSNSVDGLGHFNEFEAAFYTAELALALEHLHSHDIIYRELKPENIFFNLNGHLRISDFGLRQAFSGKISEYVAPELVEDSLYAGESPDFWSLGCFALHM